MAKYLSLQGLQTYDGKLKAWVNNLLAGKIQIKSVATLPATGESNIIYLVPNSGTGNNVKDEYIYVDGKFELIGTTAVDLSGFYTKESIDTLLKDKIGKVADAKEGNVPLFAADGSLKDSKISFGAVSEELENVTITANNAKSIAEGLSETVAEAKTAADNAQTTADEAKTAVDDLKQEVQNNYATTQYVNESTTGFATSGEVESLQNDVRSLQDSKLDKVSGIDEHDLLVIDSMGNLSSSGINYETLSGSMGKADTALQPGDVPEITEVTTEDINALFV
ncbi:MAG: hypothetical protein NC346_02400 [Prevotella sp.]|nr:hypothetical protein [Bacteroidales bacterium]MCM1068725.1 hypothetical protein [Prevotella sp.]